MYYNIK